MILLGAILGLFSRVKTLEHENLAHQNNISVLIDSVATYRVMDSLNAAQIGGLQLKLSEYKALRQEDAKIISELKSDKSGAIINAKLHTDTQIIIETRDSVVYKDTVKTINYNSKWLSLSGYIDKDTILLDITNREELILVESLQRKKFLFFKLPARLFGYKRKTVDIISKNPNTKIIGLEYVNIR